MFLILQERQVVGADAGFRVDGPPLGITHLAPFFFSRVLLLFHNSHLLGSTPSRCATQGLLMWFTASVLTGLALCQKYGFLSFSYINKYFKGFGEAYEIKKKILTT